SVNVTINNQGNADAGTFTVELLDGTTSLGTQNITNLPTGTNTTLNWTWTPTTTGTHTLKAVADNDNVITESNESNNEITRDFSVNGVPDLVSSNLSLPSNPIVCNTYPVTFTVTNQGTGNAGSFT